MDFKVIEILSADEIIVEPEWVYNGLTGKKVVIWGYETPKKGMYGFDFAKQKLKAILYKKDVKLFTPTIFKDKTTENKILCRVYLEGIDISNYFPEFKKRNTPPNDNFFNG